MEEEEEEAAAAAAALKKPDGACDALQGTFSCRGPVFLPANHGDMQAYQLMESLGTGGFAAGWLSRHLPVCVQE